MSCFNKGKSKSPIRVVLFCSVGLFDMSSQSEIPFPTKEVRCRIGRNGADLQLGLDGNFLHVIFFDLGMNIRIQSFS